MKIPLELPDLLNQKVTTNIESFIAFEDTLHIHLEFECQERDSVDDAWKFKSIFYDAKILKKCIVGCSITTLGVDTPDIYKLSILCYGLAVDPEVYIKTKYSASMIYDTFNEWIKTLI